MNERFQKMRATTRARWEHAKENPVEIDWRKVLPVLFVAAMLIVMTVPAFAQATDSLDIDTEDLQSGLFEGANVILGALGAIMFLLAGFRFGGSILRMIIDTVTGFRL